MGVDATMNVNVETTIEVTINFDHGVWDLATVDRFFCNGCRITVGREYMTNQVCAIVRCHLSSIRGGSRAL